MYYIVSSKEAEFWCNILLGIFGGSVLTLISSIIGYKVERKRILEKFYYNKLMYKKEYSEVKEQGVADTP